MKKYNVYTSGRLYATETEDQLVVDLQEEHAKVVKNLKLGERHLFHIGKRDWEIERVV